MDGAWVLHGSAVVSKLARIGPTVLLVWLSDETCASMQAVFGPGLYACIRACTVMCMRLGDRECARSLPCVPVCNCAKASVCVCVRP
eukprot:15362583-Alexandrium_andersonii.AAC.1